MNLLLLLFILGVVCLAAEVFLPGGILGIVGGLFLVGGVIVAYALHGMPGAILALLIGAGLVGLTLFIELWWVPRTKWGKRLVLQADIAQTSQPALADATVIGKKAEALTALSPTGYVLVEEKRYEAASRSGFIAKGSSLTVVGLDNFRLIVSL